MAGKTPLEDRRARSGSRVRPGIQRGVFVAAMELNVILYLGLLLLVALLRLVELGISRRHQQQMVARGASKVVDPRFRWMVLLHTSVLLGSALEVVFLRRPF